MLTQKEQEVKDFMFGVFIPSIHEVLKNYDSKKYEQWNGNCCRQTAIFGACILQQLLPEYTWKVWDGVMDDIIENKKVTYNHAWILGSDGKKRILVDLARTMQERLFIEVKSNKYPSDNPEYKNMVILKKEQIDWNEALKDIEFYSGIQGHHVLTVIIMTMQRKSVGYMMNKIFSDLQQK